MPTLKPLYFFVSLTLTFALGLALGFVVRPLALPVEAEVVVEEVVVTVEVTPEVVAEAPSDPAPAPADASVEEVGGAPTPTIMDFLLSDARHFQGDADAPVTIIEFSDFRCGFCGRFAAETLPQLREAYIDTGRVRFVYKHLAILGPDSVKAAEASECAAEQDLFWDFHNLVFADQATNHTPLNEENLISFADDVGLDPDTYRECLTSGRYTQRVMQESGTIQSLGVRGTPGFLINGVYVSGAQPFPVFQQVIEEELASLE